METIIFYALLVFALYMLRKNFLLAKRNNHNKEYVAAAGEIFARKASASEHIKNFVEKEENKEYQNKGRILQLYDALDHHTSPESVLQDLDLEPLFTQEKGVQHVFSEKKVQQNADSMVWSMLVLIKMKAEGATELIPTFMAKFPAQESLRHHMEFLLLEHIAAYLTSTEKDSSFFRNIATGEYQDILYDRQLIGLYKRLCSFFLAQEGVEEEYVASDVESFAKSSVGKMMMEDLGVYEKYAPKEETTEEVTTPNENIDEDKTA